MKTLILAIIAGGVLFVSGCKRMSNGKDPKSQIAISIISESKMQPFGAQDTQNFGGENILHESVLFERFY